MQENQTTQRPFGRAVSEGILRAFDRLDEERDTHTKFCQLIKNLWLLTADRRIDDSEVEDRARAWMQVVDGKIFDEYLRYTIRALLASRTVRGPVQADEFLRVWIKVRSLGQIWDAGASEWIPLKEAVFRNYQASAMRQLDPAGSPVNPPPDVYEVFVREIYGWR